MKSLNTVQLIGHLGNDPESIKHDDKLIVKLSIATNESWTDKTSKEKKTATEWHRVVCFNKLAEVVDKYLKKGTRVYLSGKLKTSKWKDKNDETHATTEIVADELIMLDGKLSEKDPIDELE
jgi:single-strand DNA-binding protein